MDKLDALVDAPQPNNNSAIKFQFRVGDWNTDVQRLIGSCCEEAWSGTKQNRLEKTHFG